MRTRGPIDNIHILSMYKLVKAFESVSAAKNKLSIDCKILQK